MTQYQENKSEKFKNVLNSQAINMYSVIKMAFHASSLDILDPTQRIELAIILKVINDSARVIIQKVESEK